MRLEVKSFLYLSLMRKSYRIYTIIIVLLLSVNSFSQIRKNLIFEYKKMQDNASYLGFKLEKTLDNSSNEEIQYIIEKTWLKKQIIILLQLTGYLDNPVCFVTDIPDQLLSKALQSFSENNDMYNDLNISSSTRYMLFQNYINIHNEQSLPYLIKQNNLIYDRSDILIRVFKKELILELWVKPHKKNTEYIKLKEYNILADNVARLGPKLKLGDQLTPEGIYKLEFYPAFKWSDFYLAFKVSYPNEADIIRRNFWDIREKAGGAINLHGCCVSIGCIPIGNPAMEEVFFLIRSNQLNGCKIDVHIFPFQFNSKNNSPLLEEYKNKDQQLFDFWTNLKEIDSYFIKNKMIAEYNIDNRGYYKINK